MVKRNERETKNQSEEWFLICELTFKEESKNPNNAYFRTANVGKGFKGMFMRPEYKAYKQKLIDLAAETVGGDYVPYEGDIKIESYWTFGTKRRKDLQNCGKLEFDALNGIVYADDSQIVEDHRFKLYEKNNPLIVIKVYGR